MKYVINIELMMGPYKGYKVQLMMTIPDEYPIKPPKVVIYPGQRIDSDYHHHIFSDYYQGFKKFCIDLLDNEFSMNTNEAHTGWNPLIPLARFSSRSRISLVIQIAHIISHQRRKLKYS